VPFRFRFFQLPPLKLLCSFSWCQRFVGNASFSHPPCHPPFGLVFFCFLTPLVAVIRDNTFFSPFFYKTGGSTGTPCTPRIDLLDLPLFSPFCVLFLLDGKIRIHLACVFSPFRGSPPFCLDCGQFGFSSECLPGFAPKPAPSFFFYFLFRLSSPPPLAPTDSFFRIKPNHNPSVRSPFPLISFVPAFFFSLALSRFVSNCKPPRLLLSFYTNRALTPFCLFANARRSFFSHSTNFLSFFAFFPGFSPPTSSSCLGSPECLLLARFSPLVSRYPSFPLAPLPHSCR